MAGQAKGSSSRLIFELESSTYGTPLAAASRAPIILPFNSADLDAGRPLNQANTLRGDRNASQPYRDRMNVAGNVVIPVDPAIWIYILTCAIGTPTKTGPTNIGGTDYYDYEFKVGATAGLKSFILEKGFPDLASPVYELFTGCKINTLELTNGTSGELTASLGIMGANKAKSGTAYDVAPATAAASFSGERFHVSDATAFEGGSESSVIKEFRLSINNNLDGEGYVIGGGGVRTQMPEGIIGVGGSISAMFKDETILDKAISAVESQLRLKLTRGEEFIEFDMPEVKYSEASPAVSGPAGVMLDLDWQAYYHDSAAASAIVATIRSKANVTIS